MNDNRRRTRDWQRLVGEFLAPRLGGDRASWAEANRAVFERSWQRYLDAQHGLASAGYPDYLAFWDEERDRWLREMCEQVGVPAPSGEACLQLARETELFVIPRVRAAFPGAVEAIRELHALGYTLSTASGGASQYLDGYLRDMGVRELFTPRLYGPDLVEAHKESPEFYARILADAGIEPAEALVVDDSPHALQRAAQAGAATVLVSGDAPAAAEPWMVISSLAELPALLERR
ncbi:MAG: hypothetical protein A2148_02135 [Chloroflexi bacterium RBG_16_68_14]|nr:MAG: hypothetical protein A2148_02135 [Chloroflexi bacterium RBG_16_68_14]